MAWLRKLIIVTLSFFLLSSCDFITNQDITITQSTESGAIYLINIDNLTIKESSEENSPFHVLNSEYLLLYSEERGTDCRKRKTDRGTSAGCRTERG